MNILKTFYDSLENGKIISLKCKECATYVFPPKPICPNCFSRNLEWAELSGEGKLICFSSSIVPAPPFREDVPYAYGLVKLKEGPIFYSMIEGLDVSEPTRIRESLEKLPINVKAIIKKKNETRAIAFRVVE